MDSPVEKRLRLRLPQIMRPRLGWSTAAREDAMVETLSTMALASKSSGDVLSALRLTGQSPTVPLGAHPLLIVYAGTMLLLMAASSMVFPFTHLLEMFFPFTNAAGVPYLQAIPLHQMLIPLALFLATFFYLRSGAKVHRRVHCTRLLTVELCQTLADEMTSGLPLSDAMKRFPNVFSPAQTSVIRSGEQTGDLSGALSCLAREVSVRQSGKVIDTLRVYFLMSLFFITSLGLFIMGKILPKFLDIFEQLHIPLSSVHTGIISFLANPQIGSVLLLLLFCVVLDHLIRQHFGRWVTVFICHMVLIYGFVMLINMTAFVFPFVGPGGGVSPFEIITQLLPLVFGLLVIAAGVPLISDLVRGAVCTLISWITWLTPSLRRHVGALERGAFFDTLGRMLACKTPAPEAIRAAAPTLTPLGLQGRANHAAALVEKGVDLTESLLRLRLINKREAVLFRLAAHAGHLPEKCSELAIQLAEDARAHIQRMERVLRPLAVLIIAFFAFGILVLIYQPIFNLPMSVKP